MYSDGEMVLTLSMEISELTFVVKKKRYNIMILSPGCLFLENRRENLKINVVLVVVLVLESKAL